jgi:pimeloyl-ACP methyl ester carboxylesterase
MPIVDFTLVDATLRATVTGTGPAVLLLHAGGEQRTVWSPVAARMNGLRMVAVDLRGHGESSGQATTLRAVTDDIIEIVKRLPEPIVLVGASLGGLAAMAALAEPAVAQRVTGLVLVDVVPDPHPDQVRPWLRDQGLSDRYPEIVNDILTGTADLLSTVSTLKMPILLVRAGPESPICDADVERLCAANRSVTVARVPEASHLVARDAPVELARIVSAHVAENLSGRAFELQRSLGADKLEHPGGTLLAHLGRVHDLTLQWNAASQTQLAAICHASYGTDGFPHALLPVTDRLRLQRVIGSDAEALVYLYGACDRGRTYPLLGEHPLPMTDRFTSTVTAIDGALLHDFAVLTIANELDVARHAQLPASTLRGIQTLFDRLASYAPDEAAQAMR